MGDTESDIQPEEQFVEQPTSLEGQMASSDLSVTELGLRARARNVLLGAGVNTISDVLAALDEGDQALTNLRGFGPKSLVDLKERLRERGFLLPGEVAPPPKVVEAVEERAAPEEEAPREAGVVAAEAVPEPVVPPEVVEEAAPEEEAPREAGVVAAEAVPGAVALGEPLPLGERFRATLAQARERFSIGAWLYIAIGALVIAALLLPPISLLERLGIVGYTVLDAANSTISHPDGLTLSVDQEAFTDRLRVRLGSVTRLEFLEGSAGAALRRAVEALPDHLVVKSPLYQIRVRGKSSQPVAIDVVMPNNAVPWETLDLYTWTGEAWEWVGSELHAEVVEHEFIRAQVTDVPASVVVVQAKQITPTVAISLEPDDNPVTTAAGVLDEVNPTGLLLGNMGGFTGDPDNLLQPDEGAAYAVLPTLRNWAPGATVNWGLLSDVLTMSEVQEAHIANIVQLCTERGFAGVDMDYQGVAPEDRDAYSDFISALSDALHAEGLRLTVVVEAPTPTDGEWDTGGYDWVRLGAAADTIKIPFPEDPTAYVEGGETQRLLDWATARVERYKLRMLVSSLSVERSSDEIRTISLEQALAPFGEVVTIDDVSQVEPGSQVEFGLSGRLLSITPQETTGTYRLQYEAEDGGSHTVWLGTAANLATKLHWALRYHLGGIAVADMLDPGNDVGIVDAVASYRTAATPPVGQEVEVVWTAASAATIVDQQTSPFTEPGYTWMVMATSGTYTVGATIAGFDHGSVAVTVGESAPAATPVAALVVTPEVTTTVETTATVATREVISACLNASYIADVTIPDNTQVENEEEFEKIWRVRNSGTCVWPEDALLAFASGAQMGAPESVEVGAAEPGEEVDVSVRMKAPADPGVYQGTWRLKMPEGFFGTNLSVVVQAGDMAEVVPTPEPGVVPPAPAPVSGGSFELGAHITGGFSHADKMHYAGMTWAKEQVGYGGNASSLIADAHANGFKIQVSALGSADMVTKSGFEQDYANWVAGIAAAGADAIEIWNEPNIEREWQIGHISPQAYTNLLCAAYSAIKAANPGTLVISGAPAPTGWFGGCSPNGCDDAPWMAGLRDAGAANCMDYIGAHHNAGATSPSARSGHPAGTHHSWYFLPQTELYYNTFGGARKVFYTEMGYASQEGVPTFSDAFAWARGITNAQQAAWLAEAAQLSTSTGMVRCIIIWNIGRSRYAGYDPQDGYNIIRPGGGCPACDALNAVLGPR